MGSVSSWSTVSIFLPPVDLGFQAIPGEPALPRQGVQPALVVAHVEQRVLDVGVVGDVGQVELLDVVLADQPGHHPVRADPHVAAGVGAGGEQGAHLGVELVVVVVVLGVVDLDPGLLGERGQGWVALGLLVDVEVRRPVRPVDHHVGSGHVRGCLDQAFGRAAGRGVGAGRAAGCERGGGGDSRHTGHCRAPGNQTSGHGRLEDRRNLIAHELSSVCSGWWEPVPYLSIPQYPSKLAITCLIRV